MTAKDIEREKEIGFLQAIPAQAWRLDGTEYVLFMNSREPSFSMLGELPSGLQEELAGLEAPYRVERISGGGIPGLHRITMSREMVEKLGIIPCIKSEETQLYVSRLEREREEKEPEGRG